MNILLKEGEKSVKEGKKCYKMSKESLQNET